MAPSSGLAPAPQPPGARPRDEPWLLPRRAPRKVRWGRIAVITGAVVCVLALVAGAVVIALRHRSAPCVPAASYTECGALAAGSAFPDPLFAQMAGDMKAHDETAFLASVAPGAKPVLRAWYESMQALGFNAVVIRAAGRTVVPVGSNGNGTIQVSAGTRNPLDPQFSVSSRGAKGTRTSYPVVPSQVYQVRFHQAGFGTAPEITSWLPVTAAPWDMGVSLYVRHGAGVTVAGYPDEKALVDETVPVAEKAASYVLAFFRKFVPDAVQQSGFVVFVSASAARRTAWFGNGEQVKGWMPGPDGLTVPEAGVASSGPSPEAIGGSRIVLNPVGGDSGETAALVNEFVHAIYVDNDISGAADPLWSLGTDDNVPTWAVEGVARFVEALYRTNPNPVLTTYPATWLNQTLAHFPAAQFPKQPPTTAQLYQGSDSASNTEVNIAASLYVYVATKYYGIGTVLTATLRAYLTDNSPLDDITLPTKLKPPTAAAILAAWPAWFSQNFK